MNVIDKFLDTYNYKFKAGVFNPNDKDDLLLLEKIIPYRGIILQT